MTATSNPLRLSGAGVDLSPRVQQNATVVASPSGSTETIVGSITISGDIVAAAGILVFGFGAYTVGGSGVSVDLKLRKTDASGSTLGATGAVDIAATKLGSGALFAFDTSPSLPGQVYVLTATVASGAAETTFSAVKMLAVIV
ncbi:MAG TPA: hypothetical protein VNC18_17555 [Gemmatimonadaceae bacterium]|nr:hypothetical protein [Gemmatimonadaceae bacterium]